MASIIDLISRQVNSVAGGAQIPSGVKDQVLGGLSQSVLGSLTQTAASAGGIEQIRELVTGKVSPEKAPITAIAGSIFGIIKDQDGDGDIDFNDLIIMLKGNGGGLFETAKSILGGLFGK